MKKALYILCLNLSFITIKSQDVFIVVYQGKVGFKDCNSSDRVVLDCNLKYAIPPDKNIKFESGRAIVFTKNKYFEVNNADCLSYRDIVNKLRTISAKTQSFFWEYTKKLHVFSEIQKSTKGAVAGGTRAIDDKTNKKTDRHNETFFPVDSAKMLSNSIHLKWELENKLFGAKLIVVNKQTNDTVYNKIAPQQGEIELVIEKEGSYNWFIYSGMEKKKYIYRLFIKPGEAERKNLVHLLKGLKTEIAAMDDDLKNMVIEDFLYQNKIAE